MANRIKWYKRDPDAALNGMAELTLEERGAYDTVLDLIYSRDGKVDDDERFLAGWMRVDVRVWKRIRARLIALGKLYVDENSLRNRRADREVSKALLRIASAEDAGRASAAKREADRNSFSDLSSTDDERTLQLSTTTSTSKQRERPSPPPSPPELRAREAAEIVATVLSGLSIGQRADAGWRGFAAWIERELAEGIDKTDLIGGISQALRSLSGPPSTFEYFRAPIMRAVSARAGRHQSGTAKVSLEILQFHIEREFGIRRGSLTDHVDAARLAELHASFSDRSIGMPEIIADLRNAIPVQS
jgi:uncharacterized protein YdaU (DUF1376 family)